MVFLRNVITIPFSCDNAIMGRLSQVFLEPYTVCSDNAIRSFTDVIGTTASPNKHYMRSHWAQYSVLSQDCSLVKSVVMLLTRTHIFSVRSLV